MNNDEMMNHWRSRAEHHCVPAPTRLAACHHGTVIVARSLAFEILNKVAPACSAAKLQATPLTALAWEFLEQGDKIGKLERRLSAYECPQHPEPKFGECDECDKHDQSVEATPL